MNIEIKKLGSQSVDEFKELIRVFENVFEMESLQMPDEAYLRQLLKKQDFFVFAAFSDDMVVGGLTSYTLHQYYSKLPLVYIYDLAVKTKFQRQGIGKMLILGITNYCKNMDVEEVFVQADEEDGHAIEFYHSTGATAEKVIHFSYPLNVE
ncbi:MAG: acetyltransferase, family [Sphingobacteriales bacterium]|nr:acetyltransferase, family [Sphingobacteriales bacterium]